MGHWFGWVSNDVITRRILISKRKERNDLLETAIEVLEKCAQLVTAETQGDIPVSIHKTIIQHQQPHRLKWNRLNYLTVRPATVHLWHRNSPGLLIYILGQDRQAAFLSLSAVSSLLFYYTQLHSTCWVSSLNRVILKSSIFISSIWHFSKCNLILN